MTSGSAPATGAELQAVYQDIILDHYRRPRNRGRIPDASATAAMRNPLCGDEIDLDVSVEGNRVREIRFEGRGCSISQASASMMTELVRGQTLPEARALRQAVRAMLSGAESPPSLGPFVALAGVSRFPTRIPCALMAWDALEQALGTVSE